MISLGDELREARLAAGLSQRQLGEAAGISHTEVGRIEHAAAVRVPYQTLAIIGAVLGLDISLRAYPDAEPIRDIAQVTLLAKLRSRLPIGITWRAEVPLRQSRDRRAWDAEIGASRWRLPVDAETRLRDVQAFARREALKLRDDGAAAMVLRLAAADLASQFPVKGSSVLAALQAGHPPAGSGIVLL